MNIAIVDIGTNSTRLLLSEVVSGVVRIVNSGLITTRLGEGIGKQPYLLSAAIERTLEALAEFRRRIAEAGPADVVTVATSAVRDAVNRNEFLSKVKNRVGWDVRVLSGEEEARMSFMGVIRGLKHEIRNPVVIDIGGGSTEFIWAGSDGMEFRSLRVGAVRMTEKNSRPDEIKDMLAGVVEPIKKAGLNNLIGVGGTVTTLAAVDQRLEIYDPARVHGYFISKKRVLEILDMFEGTSLEQRLQVPGLQRERADIIAAGIAIVLAIIEGLGAPGIIVSETDIMYGLLISELESKNIQIQKFLLSFEE